MLISAKTIVCNYRIFYYTLQYDLPVAKRKDNTYQL